MNKLSNIIGLQVISLYEGQTIGYIKNAIFVNNYSKISAFLICNEFSNDTDCFMLNCKDVYKIKDVMYIKNSALLLPSQDIENTNIINLKSYNENAEFLGIINDVELDENFRILKYLTLDGSIKGKLIKANNNFALFSSHLKSVANFKPKIVAVFKPKTFKTILPSKTTANFNYLIGRKVYADILNEHSELIIKNGTTINDRIILIAKHNNKLRELALNS